VTTVAANVRTKSVYESPAADDGKRILATQYWPRGVSRDSIDEYVRALAPSRELLHSFKDGAIAWSELRNGYLTEMQGEDRQREIKRIAKIAAHEPINLLCVCRDAEQCHRSILAELVGAAAGYHEMITANEGAFP